ncbi:ABC transporter substrate-binding protein [Paenibacillus radicis (ex Gao et al. 2016)]|uniref:Extracellular solute-binding protein n=1 Tax=Paenibacillus radicis (ex Gao et al. 2016) TaxID=1737354 RepID=A0A917HC06_9BACL|nr:extracellular solute-binding protein [Paenibacillus radicis (ex Gao et al. 2016)]GGG73684.1 hypothetical protein GCM10010918_32210 [Paenibacillus radicis (ex Gao et al. 2016)]
MKAFKALLAILLCSMIVSGCANKEDESSFEKDKHYKLKVMAPTSDSFFEAYGTYINMEFPNVEFEVIPAQDIYDKEKLLQTVSAEQPDLYIGMHSYLMDILQEEQKLLPLRNRLGKETLKSLHPGVKQQQEYLGDGEIYTIPLLFGSNVLFLNKDLFIKQGISLPDESVSWQELFQLARRFSGSETEGLYSNSYSLGSFVTWIGLTEGLTYLNRAVNKVTLNTDSWRKIVELIKPMYEEGLLNDLNANAENPFLEGNVAMTFANSYFYDQLNERNTDFEWRVLPVPGKDRSAMEIDPERLVGISSSSQQDKEAIKFIRYLMSGKMSNIQYHSSSLLSSSLLSEVNTNPAHPLHFIYSKDANISALEQQKRSFYTPTEFQSYFDETLLKIMNNELDVQDGLQSIEDFGNTRLQAK